ncbi:hypothetical protein HPB49_015238 [Dermacentor silvarum]|uniref:Uncharacterized protein n=1 Tax=Dermacentor silvarum TaxID=543639 RepID=A0ACB8E0E7_DERSI|nr:hypothetical protein HPB49_015238 [Dermacentor silvarum]
MKPWSGRLREYAPYLVVSCPSVCLSVNQALSNLRHLLSTLNPCRVDHDKSCAASVADCCFLLAELSGWNRFRSIVNIELRELRPGWLGLACLSRRVVRVSSKIQRRYPFLLVHGLLKEGPSIELLELRSSSISQNHLFVRDGIEQSGNLVEIVSAYFSSVGVPVLCALLVRCEALCTLVLLENWIYVPEADTLTRCGAGQHGLRKIHVDSCYMLADLVSCSAVIDELVVSRRARCTYGKYHGLATLFSAVADRCTPLKTFEMYNLELNQVDLRDFTTVLRVNGKVESLTGTCIAATANLQLSLVPVISHMATLAEFHVSSCLVSVVNLGDITKVIDGNATLKKLSFNQVYLRNDATLRLVDILTVNLALGLLSLGMLKQRGLANFSKQVGDRDRSRVKFKGFYAVIDSLVTYLQHGPKTCQATFQTSAPLSWSQFQGLTRRLCGNAYLSRLAVRMVSVTGCNLAVLLPCLPAGVILRDAPLTLAVETLLRC